MTRDLRTARLCLRAPVAADAGWIAQEIARPEVHRMLTSPPYPYRLEHAEAWIAGQTEANGTHVIEADRPIGVVNLRKVQSGEASDDLGYWLRMDAWGHGYMTEAAGALVERHFANGGDTVRSGHITDNPGSRNVLKKLGFRDTHIQMMQCNFRRGDAPVQRMELTATDWAARPRP